MTDEMLYANQWNISAKYFYEKGYYFWMGEKLSQFNTVLEIGCGTGYSTLALVEKGYKVIAVEKNKDCITQAKELLSKKGFTEQSVIFVEGDIVEDDVRKSLLNQYEFDVVICWNVGSFWNRKMIEYYIPFMLKYGLNREQIVDNIESSYSELIIWDVCRLASAKGVAAHIIDRSAEAITAKTDPYYYLLKKEFNFLSVEYDNKVADSISGGGRILTTNGNANFKNKVNIVFVSILYKP